MSDAAAPRPGTINWVDLTVADAPGVRDFYTTVVGWESSGVDMGGYEDWCAAPPGEAAPVAGICHARGGNTSLPPVWVVYFTVADIDQSLESVRRLGGEVLNGPRSMGKARYAVVRDPAGAACALFQPG